MRRANCQRVLISVSFDWAELNFSNLIGENLETISELGEEHWASSSVKLKAYLLLYEFLRVLLLTEAACDLNIALECAAFLIHGWAWDLDVLLFDTILRVCWLCQTESGIVVKVAENLQILDEALQWLGRHQYSVLLLQWLNSVGLEEPAMLRLQVWYVNARIYPVKAATLTWIDHQVLIVKVEENLSVIRRLLPNVQVDVLQDFVQLFNMVLPEVKF